MRFVEIKGGGKDADYARGNVPMPKKKKRGKHPLEKQLVGSSVENNNTPMNEAARIQHAEDIVFWEGSKGVARALESLKSLEQGKHSDVTIKWDGSPAVIFGRDENGEFIFTDKSGFTAKGYNGKTTSAKEINQMLMGRPGAKNPDKTKRDNYMKFVNNMTDVFDEYEKAVPKDYRGFFKGDMLYFNTPEVKDGNYIFTPNIVTYTVKTDSDIGKRIGASKTGIVIHREVDASGAEGPLTTTNIFQGNEVLVLPPVTVQQPPQVNDSHVKELQAMLSKSASAIDSMLNVDTLTQLKLKKLPDLFYAYLNSKVDTGLTNIGGDFLQWLGTKPSVSETGKKRVAEYVAQNQAGFNAMWQLVAGIMKVKDDIINQLETQDSDIKAVIGPHGPTDKSTHGEGGEGYVLSHPGGDIKLVPRQFFSKANRSVQR
jgi:hypothetical protein